MYLCIWCTQYMTHLLAGWYLLIPVRLSEISKYLQDTPDQQEEKGPDVSLNGQGYMVWVLGTIHVISHSKYLRLFNAKLFYTMGPVDGQFIYAFARSLNVLQRGNCTVLQVWWGCAVMIFICYVQDPVCGVAWTQMIPMTVLTVFCKVQGTGHWVLH